MKDQIADDDIVSAFIETQAYLAKHEGDKEAARFVLLVASYWLFEEPQKLANHPRVCEFIGSGLGLLALRPHHAKDPFNLKSNRRPFWKEPTDIVSLIEKYRTLEKPLRSSTMGPGIFELVSDETGNSQGTIERIYKLFKRVSNVFNTELRRRATNRSQ